MNSIRLFLAAAALAAAASATTYDVGPGFLPTIASVPWATLQPGDIVNIHYQQTPYKEKWVICRQGVTVHGVPDSVTLALPVIDGDGAVTPTNLNFWNQDRGLIKIGGATVPADTMPQSIVIENLEVMNAKSGNTFYDYTGKRQRYASNAAGIYVEKGQHVIIRNCKIHTNSNGIFASSNKGGAPTSDILVEANYIWDNGNKRSDTEHNVYTESLGITYQYNHFGPVTVGSNGNNIKDRSAGTVIRYNWIEGGARQMDLVDSSNPDLQMAQTYGTDFVYGNVALETTNDVNWQIVHWGGDQGNTAVYRNKKLYFYDNTVVSSRTDGVAIFRLDMTGQQVDARNNILYETMAGATIAILQGMGNVNLTDNWINQGFQKSYSTTGGFSVVDDGTNGDHGKPDPGFVPNDYHLASTSVCINAGGSLSPDPAVSAYPVSLEYVEHQSYEPRCSIADIGAFQANACTATTKKGKR